MTPPCASLKYSIRVRELRSRRRALCLIFAVAFWLACLWSSVIRAHAFAPSLLELRLQGGGAVDVTWRTPAIRPAGVVLEPQLPGSCSPAGAVDSERRGSAMVTRLRVQCGSEDLRGEVVGIRGLAESRTAGLIRIYSGERLVVSSLLQNGESSLEIAAPPSRTQVMTSYLRLGFGHILSGFDHLAFVLGLVLLLTQRTRLLLAISAFTVGHSATLALAAVDVIRVRQSLVEIAIAFSIALVAVEITLLSGRARPGLIGRRPWLACGGFGLLHGLGFAGVLRELGLPAGEVPLALFSFNVGIEAGQLLFVGLLVALGTAIVRAGGWLRPGWKSGAAYAMGSLAMFWCFERVWAVW